MIIPPERWLLDTNVWIFGLRRDTAFPACAELLDRLGSFSVLIPLQVMKELNVALAEDEMQAFYEMINHYPDHIDLNWQAASPERIRFYQNRGCRKGDAVIAAHAEQSGIGIIVSENRQFLQTLTNLPIKIVNATEAAARLDSSS
jgi:predicted nucleic acid-binding protein